MQIGAACGWLAVVLAAGCGGHLEAPCDGPRDARIAVLPVEDQAPFVRQLADRVRADPGAAAAGIAVAEDEWRQDVTRGDFPVDTISAIRSSSTRP
jgi:hypothetical protein